MILLVVNIPGYLKRIFLFPRFFNEELLNNNWNNETLNPILSRKKLLYYILQIYFRKWNFKKKIKFPQHSLCI